MTATRTRTPTLADAALTIAARGAAEYLTRHGMTADPGALLECLQAHVKARIEYALNDARDAFACGMDQVATRTFSASMILAGIEAAKEAGTTAN